MTTTAKIKTENYATKEGRTAYRFGCSVHDNPYRGGASHNNTAAQNWRKGWHAERLETAGPCPLAATTYRELYEAIEGGAHKNTKLAKLADIANRTWDFMDCCARHEHGVKCHNSGQAEKLVTAIFENLCTANGITPNRLDEALD